jgi:protein-arginine kinase activator protein McsA
LSDDNDQTLEQRLNQKLKEAIEKEDYESASKIRDHMRKLNFKKY